MPHLGGMLATTMAGVTMIHRRWTSVGRCTGCIARCIEIMLYRLYFVLYWPIQQTIIVTGGLQRLYSYTALYSAIQRYTALYSAIQRYTAIQLYSSYTLYILYNLPLARWLTVIGDRWVGRPAGRFCIPTRWPAPPRREDLVLVGVGEGGPRPVSRTGSGDTHCPRPRLRGTRE